MKQIKSILATFTVVLGALFAHGAIEEVDGIKWWYKTCDGGVEISSGSSAAAIDTETAGDITIPSVLGGMPVVAIGDYAFDGCTQITNVVIPTGVKSVGGWAFAYCTGMRSIVLPDTVTTIGTRAFMSCGSLKSFYAQGVVEVADSAFVTYNTETESGLQSVNLPNAEVIGGGAFSGCANLTSVSLPNVRILGDNAFSRCSTLNNLVFSKIETIGQSAFSSCSRLNTIALSDKIRHVYNEAFVGTALCNNFSENSLKVVDGKVVLGWQGSCPHAVTIPAGIRVVAVAAFADCRNLDAVTLPEGLVTIEGSAFTGTSLTAIAFPSTLSEIGVYSFYNCSGITALSLPSSLQTVGNSAFNGCDAVSTLTIADGVESIGWESFRGCTSLTSLSVPSSVTNVGHNAFAECSGLRTVDINMSEDDLYLGNTVFNNCSALESIHFKGETTCFHVPSWYSDPFGNCVSMTSVKFDGNAPTFGETSYGNSYSYSSYFYSGLPETLTTYVPYGSTGWSSESSSRLPSEWCGRAIAHYGTPRTHTVTFDPQWSGANVTNIVYEDETQVRAPSVPSRTGWSFRGWYDDSTDGDYVVGSGSTFYPGGDVTLYGHWERSGSGDDIEDNLRYAYDRKTGYTWSFLPDEDTGTASLIGVEPVPEGVLTIPSTVKDNDSDSTFTVISLGYDNHESSGCSFCGGSSSYASDFQCLDGITSLVIPSTVKSIGRESFRGCTSLETLTIPSSVTYLGSGAFAETGLKNVTIPVTVTSFSLSAFDSCKQLETLTVAAKTVSSGCSMDLYDCPKLTTLNLPDSVEGVDPENDDWYSMCLDGLSSIASLTVPEGVTSLECWSGDWTNLASAYLPSTLDSISSGAFVNCWKLDKTVFAGDVPVYAGDGGGVDALDTILYFANSIYYPSAYAAHWEKILRNSGYGGTYGVYAPSQAKTMVAMVTAAPAYATEEVPDVGPFVATVSAQQTLSGAEGAEMSNVPDGLTWDSSSATLSGTPTKSGMYTVQLGGEDLTLRIDPSPDQEEEGDVIEIVCGMKVDLDLELVGYTAKNLPKGLSYNSRTGKLSGTAKTVTDSEGAVVTFTKKDAEKVEMTFVVRAENAPTIICEGLTNSTMIVGVACGAVGGGTPTLPIAIDAESGVKSVAATKLPTGMKIASSKDKTSWYITGAPTKAGTYEVAITLTTAAGNKVTEKFTVTVAALPSGATGTFNGFVVSGALGDRALPDDETVNVGSLQVTVSDVGKITAKVVAAAGTYSFTATGWDSVNEGIYSVEMTTKKGDALSLTCDSGAAWNTHQLTGSFAAKGATALSVEAQKNAFGKQWFFKATGDDANGWALSFAENAKAAALTVTLNADGKTSVAGKLGTYKITASGYADVSGIGTGAIFADFAPIVTVGKAKKTLSLRANLWFDKKNEHEQGVGSAVFVP